MLKLKPCCECCATDLPPDSDAAMICSFECTFCSRCVQQQLRGKCPNCGGELQPRPRRPARLLAKYPPSPERVVNPAGCGGAN